MQNYYIIKNKINIKNPLFLRGTLTKAQWKLLGLESIAEPDTASIYCLYGTKTYIRALKIAVSKLKEKSLVYRIAPNFRGAQFSRIGVFKNFEETIFALATKDL